MQWFKHYSDIRKSNTISCIIAEHGLEGYARYLILLEEMSKKMTNPDDTIFIFSVHDLRDCLRFRRTKDLLLFLASNSLQSVIKVTSKSHQSDIKVTSNVYQITIESSILLKLLDRDWKSARTKRAGFAPKNKNKNKNKKIYKKNDDENFELEVGEQKPGFDFVALYKKFPRKAGKEKGLEFCEKKIKTLQDYNDLGRAIDNYAKYCKDSKADIQFIKYFRSFLSEWRDWLDPDMVQVKAPLQKSRATGDEAQSIMFEIQNACTKFGNSNPSAARQHLGEDVWRYVDALGKWYNICRSLNQYNFSQYVEQLRKILKNDAESSARSFAEQLQSRMLNNQQGDEGG